MRSFFLALALGALVLSGPLSSIAYADETAAPVAIGNDVVSLKNGGMLRGTILAVEPDKQVIIVVGNEQRTVPWTDVARVDRGAETPPAATTPATGFFPPLAQPQAPVPLGRGAPFIHIESDWPDVQLGRIDGETMYATSTRNYGTAVAGGLIRPICRAPCDRVVDGREGTRFVFISANMVPSDPFFLDDKSGHLVAHVQGGSMGKRFGGLILAAFGGGLTLAGTAILGIAFSTNAFDNPSTTPIGTVGAIVFGLGVAQLVPGIVLLASSSTHVDITPSGAVALGRFRFQGGQILF